MMLGEITFMVLAAATGGAVTAAAEETAKAIGTDTGITISIGLIIVIGGIIISIVRMAIKWNRVDVKREAEIGHLHKEISIYHEIMEKNAAHQERSLTKKIDDVESASKTFYKKLDKDIGDVKDTLVPMNEILASIKQDLAVHIATCQTKTTECKVDGK